MITCCIGTRAQLIKMAPVVLELERRAMPVNVLLTGQHADTMQGIYADFGIRTIPKALYSGREITGILQMARWFARCLWTFRRDPAYFLPTTAGAQNIILVHGDTFSTLLGSVIGKMRGVKVAHVEAGLRSFNLFHPFPEELTRLAVFRLSDIGYCPGDWALGNLRNCAMEKVNTHYNTLADALAIALNAKGHEPPVSLPGAYGVVSIHRFENIFNRKRFSRIIELVELAAETTPLIFVLHPATRQALQRFGLLDRLQSNPRIKLSPRMGYFAFVQLLKGARFVVSDGGGNQEELSYLGIPTLLMRKATERQEGLQSTVTLCPYDRSILNRFLDDVTAGDAPRSVVGTISPSKLIADHLERQPPS